MSRLLRPPLFDVLVDRNGMATRTMQNWMTAINKAVPTVTPLMVTDYNATGNGSTDDTEAVQAAINQAVANGGGTVVFPSGIYSISSVTIPAGSTPIALVGTGTSSIIRRRSGTPTGSGVITILRSNVTIDSLTIDGQVTTPVGLLYNVDFMVDGKNDPMAASLTANTSVWVKGPLSNLTIQRTLFEHTAGYAVIIDAHAGGISNVRILDCVFQNNRPHLFGLTAGDAVYGSWTGGVLITGEGRTTDPGKVVKSVTVSGCQFLRGTGNQLWSHLYALDELHQDFQFYSNFFEDIGLDGILVGGVVGGSVNLNVFHRIGYCCLTDTDQGTPRWLLHLNATALDSSGLVKGVNYQANSFLSTNGGAMDLDGHGFSSLMGNLIRVPYSDEAEYEEDQIAHTGYLSSGSTSYGINLGNTANTPWGGDNVTIAGNTLINLRAGSVRLYSARNCLVTANNVIAPDAPMAPPIALGPGGPGANQRSTGNVIKHNRFAYSPAVAAPFVYEDPSVEPFTAADVNEIFGNCPIIGNGLATEFQKDPSSGSPSYLSTVWFT